MRNPPGCASLRGVAGVVELVAGTETPALLCDVPGFNRKAAHETHEGRLPRRCGSASTFTKRLRLLVPCTLAPQLGVQRTRPRLEVIQAMKSCCKRMRLLPPMPQFEPLGGQMVFITDQRRSCQRLRHGFEPTPIGFTPLELRAFARHVVPETWTPARADERIIP